MKKIISVHIDTTKSAEEKYQIFRNLIIDIVDERKKFANLSSILNKYIRVNKQKYQINQIVNYYTKFLDSYNPKDAERIYCIYHNIQKVLFCENCQQVKVKYHDFSYGYSKYCSTKCSVNSSKVKEKTKQTNLERYGVENPFQYSQFKEKTKQTNLERYGVEHVMQSEEIKEKIKQTNLERYGFDYSSQSKEIQEKLKQTNLERYGVEYPFQYSEFKEKAKQTTLERYGVEHALQFDKFQQKFKQTTLERYGVEYSLQSEVIKEKFKKTNLERYGVNYPIQSKEIQEKSKQTNLERYGVNYPFQYSEFKEKIRQTNLERYGVENPLQSEVIREKSKQTNLKKYGKEYISQVDIFKEKIKHTNLERYGVENPLQSEEIKQKIKQNFYNNNLLNKEYIKDYEPLFSLDQYKGVKGLYYKFKHRKCGHIFQCRIENGQFPKCPKCYPSNASDGERELAKFVNQYTDNIALNSRNIIPPKELDIYLPDYNLAIEYNGLYWHSTAQGKGKNYHIDKTMACWKHNIKLIQIFENEWINNQDAVKSLILQNINKLPYYINTKDCILKEVDCQEAIDFLEVHNIYSPEDYDLKLGLYYNNHLVSYMGLTKEIGYYTINNYCDYNFTEINSLPIFLDYLKDKTIKYYSNLRFDKGKIFKNNQFKKIEYIGPQSVCINESLGNYIFDCGYIEYQYN